MFRVTERSEPNLTIDLQHVADGATAPISQARVAAWRGGMLTHLEVNGDEVLYLDEATLLNEMGNVRGGAPVLFPSPGKLTNDAWSYGGRSGAMKQHGFARNVPWTVVRTDVTRGAAVTLRLASSDVTLAQYPWGFVAEYTYLLRAGSSDGSE